MKTGLQVAVGDAVKVDIVLEPGPVNEVVSVVSESPLLNTTTGVSGITIDAKQIAQLPLGDGTAYMLTRLAPGIMDTSDLHFARPMDNGNLAGIVSNGVQGGNEFTIDGTFNMSNARGTGFSPPSDAISSFKVQTNAFDAQVGHTAGAVVNLALKSGTNRFRAQAGYFNRDASRTNTPLLTERANGTKPSRTYNRLTGTASGPVIQGRTFFMVSAEYLRDVQPEPSTFTVPTMKMRRGDLSEFTGPIYDPNSAFLVGNTVTRLPFTGNIIPEGRINPVAAAYASYYPEPNRPGTAGNYFTNMLRPYDYHAFLTRVDHNVNEAHRLFFTGYYSKRREDRYNWALGAPNSLDGTINGFPDHPGLRLPQQHGLHRRLDLGALEHVGVRPARQLHALRGVPRSGRRVRPGRARVLADGAAADAGPQHPAPHDDRDVQHDESELDDRVARHAARRLGRGIQPSDDDVRHHADGHEALGRSFGAPGLRPAVSELAGRECRLSGRTLPVQRLLHAPQQRGGHWRSRAVVGAVPAGPADQLQRRRRDAGHGSPASSRLRRQASSARRRMAFSCRTTGA